MFSQPPRNLCLRSATACHNSRVEHNISHNAQCIMYRSFGFVDEPLASTADKDRNGLRILASLNEGHFVVSDFSLLNQLGSSQIVGLQIINVADYSAAGGLDEFLHVRLLYASYCEYPLLCEIVLCYIVYPFLAKQNVCS